MANTTRDIFALSGELSRAILASVEEGIEMNRRNAVLNRMALVGRLWHSALVPEAGACMPALTRRVALWLPLTTRYSQRSTRPTCQGLWNK